MQDENDAYFIDRDPKAFSAILKYLRTKEVFDKYEGVTLKEVHCEAGYFGLDELKDKLKVRMVNMYTTVEEDTLVH